MHLRAAGEGHWVRRDCLLRRAFGCLHRDDVAAESRRQNARRTVAFESGLFLAEAPGDTSEIRGPNCRRAYVMISR